MDKNKIAHWAGITGGGVFFILNITTKGQVPGGFKGGVAGYFIGYGISWLFLLFIPNNIYQACKNNEPKRVKDLIQKGIDINSYDSKNLSPLAYTAASGNIEILKILIDSGAKINAMHKDGLTALMNAASSGHQEVVMFLLEKGADPFIQDHNGNTASEHAQINQHKEVGSFLLDFQDGQTTQINK